jgi:selenocysteine-specific elongation factor
MYVVGTAGHVDHGKSTLVKALTNIDPDRLQEEKLREMTIDLGFAWLKLPSGKEISIVDVPGHERFIKNMLAGVGGFDATLLVIAADEGIMPQTQEHLAILNLLQVERGVVVLTKCDMVDAEWLELMKEEIREKLVTTSLRKAPLVAVSARQKYGLDLLKKVLDEVLNESPTRSDIGRPRLPIDRVFSISGFGTVVTGTLIEGYLQVGQEIEIQPGGLRSRIRGLQIHKKKVESVAPGNRVAVNLTGLEVNQLQRGLVLTVPGWLDATDRLDVRINMLEDAPVEITQNSSFDFFSGADESLASITVLDKTKLEAGASGLVQLRLKHHMALAKGDHFILRLPSPSQTIGGGIIIDPHPRRHKRFQPEIINLLETLEKGTPAEILLQALTVADKPPRDLKTLAEETDLPLDQVQSSTALLVRNELALLLGHNSMANEQKIKDNELNELASNQLVIAMASWNRRKEQVTQLLQSYHKQFPLKRGMGQEELKSRLGIANPKIYNLLLARLIKNVVIVEIESKGRNGQTLSLPDFKVEFTQDQQKQVEELLAAFRKEPFAPPSINELGIDPNLVAALVEDGRLKKITEAVYFATPAYDSMVRKIMASIDEQGSITLAQVRDMFNTSRKYCQALLEFMDEQKLTKRTGDERVRW